MERAVWRELCGESCEGRAVWRELCGIAKLCSLSAYSLF